MGWFNPRTSRADELDPDGEHNGSGNCNRAMTRKKSGLAGAGEELRLRRYKQLLGYIAELDRLRTAVVKTVREQPEAIPLSELPQHPAVEWDPSDPMRFLIVRRCEPPESPPLPVVLEGWVEYECNQVENEPRVHPRRWSDGQVIEWEEGGSAEDWARWLGEWRMWAETARPAYAARDLYTRLYDLHATVQRSPDDLELVAADVSVALSGVDHPILVNPVQLDFDPQQLTIAVGCLDESAQVYGDAIRTMLAEAGESIGRARKELEDNQDLWAFGGKEVDDFARRFVQGAHPDGIFGPAEPPPNRLSARREPWLILRRRPTGLAELAEGLKVKFEADGAIPPPISPILMDEAEPAPAPAEHDFRGEPDEDEETYFTKPANREQLTILRVYRRGGRVHVQGPPGTGKTHTIANLIGHFLAEGKSVLVTSEKAQALAVLRDKVVEELQPLCVSLVGSDAGEGLKAGMRGLFEKLGSTVPELLRSDIERLSAARLRTIEELCRARQTMREIIEREHLPVEVRDWRGSPTAAGKFLREHRERCGWIPGEVLSASEPPLTQSEFQELVDLLDQYTEELAAEARKPLPPAEEVPTPKAFQELLERIAELKGRTPGGSAALVQKLRKLGLETEQAQGLLEEFQQACASFAQLDDRYIELANQVIETPALGQSWRSLLEEARVLAERRQRVEQHAAPYDFRWPADRADLLPIAQRLLARVRKSGKPIRKAILMKRTEKDFFDFVKAARHLGEEATLEAFVALLEFMRDHDEFRKRLLALAGRFELSELDVPEPERALGRAAHLRPALDWASEHYPRILAKFDEAGLSYNPSTFVASSGTGPAERLVAWLKEVAEPALREYLRDHELQAACKQLEEVHERTKEWLADEQGGALRAVAVAVSNEDPKAYEAAYDELQSLRAAIEPVQRRDTLLAKLGSKAEEFALHLSDGRFDKGTIRGSLSEAWTYALIDGELRRRNAQSLEHTKEELERLKHQLDRTTIDLASARAWEAQHRRVTQPVSSALHRFHEAQRKIGGGQGKRVPELLRAMRQAMREAKDAFPVWIMPLYDLTKSFDFTRTKFDVVIVDEASQLSAVGLTTLLIADSAIVVGDDEQTEPSLAGVPYDRIKSLIDEHLVDFPDRVLWAPDSSLYSFAGRFGATVGLREHFRCVPQVIAFSSRLCYQGKIHPLRESRGVVQTPHVVPILCLGSSSSARDVVNEAEALEIASLLLACCEREEYQNQTFGVIALRGSADSRGMDPQTDRIAQLVREAIGPAEWERFVNQRRLKCGVPSAFQGDERDVVFISVGDDPAALAGGGPMRLLAEDTLPGLQYKKRLNVAVSRARNQVWVVHSFRHYEADLREADIRRKLLEFSYAPEQWLISVRAENPKAESPFEQAVYADLVQLGFTVTPQVPVGHYRIDLVVEDKDARVALECDGDAYHQDAAADMARQSVLERCGWKFVRLRGSEYYRDPEAAITRVVHELEKLGVTPGHAQPERTEPEGVLLEAIRARASEVRDVLREGPANFLLANSTGKWPDGTRDLPSEEAQREQGGGSPEGTAGDRPS